MDPGLVPLQSPDLFVPLSPEQYAADAERFLGDALAAMEGLKLTNPSRELSLAITEAQVAQMWLERV